MADNTIINAPTTPGQSIATKDIGGINHELVLLEFGDGAGGATEVSAADPLPVTDAAALAALAVLVSGQQSNGLTDVELRANPVQITGSVTVTGGGDATAANQTTQITAEQAIQAAVQIMDDWDESDRAKVNLIVGQAGIAAGTGVDGVTVPRVSLATNVALPAGTNNIGDVDVLTLPSIPAGNNNIGDVDVATLPALIAGSAIIGKVGIDQTTDGTTNKVRATGTQKPSIGATTVMTVTALQSLASSATAGWQSARVSNLSTLATDYEIMVKLTTANTAPANDKAMYVFISAAYTSDAGSTWFQSSQGTTTLPTGAEGTTTIASPHNLRLLGVLNYTTQQMVVQDTFLLSNCFGNRLPDGFSIIIINFSGAALSTACIVDYSPLNDILV